MAAPGWYPDPQGGPGRRYWDGQQWTPHTQQPPQQFGSQQPQPPAGQAPAPDPQRPNSLALWIALGVSVAVIIGTGIHLFTSGGAGPATTPSPTPTPVTTASATPDMTGTASTTAPADPTSAPATSAPATTASSAPATSAPATTAPVPVPEGPVQAGDVLTPLACEGNATDAVSERGTDGWYTSADGLGFAAVEGFTDVPVQQPWIHGSNSQALSYPGIGWMAFITVGTLRAEEGFTGHADAALRQVQCLIGSPAFADAFESAVVEYAEVDDENGLTLLDARVNVTGVEGVTYDDVLTTVAERDGVLHVAMAVVPDNDGATYELLYDAIEGIELR